MVFTVSPLRERPHMLAEAKVKVWRLGSKQGRLSSLNRRLQVETSSPTHPYTPWSRGGYARRGQITAGQVRDA